MMIKETPDNKSIIDFYKAYLKSVYSIINLDVKTESGKDIESKDYCFSEEKIIVNYSHNYLFSNRFNRGNN